jgi:HK97 family phage major capsid protein
LKSLKELTDAREALVQKRRGILAKVKAEGRGDLSVQETRDFNNLVERIADADSDINDHIRSGRDNPEVAAILRAGLAGGDNWATRAADALRQMGGNEARAVVSGSVDVVSLVSPNVTPKTRLERLIDLLVSRESAHSNAIEYFRQTVRTNNAATVADGSDKPTSTLTIAPVNDRCRVIAHLSQPFPIRLYQDAAAVVAWLESEMTEGVLDALEAQVITGSGSGENMTGLLTVAGTNAIAFNTSVPITLRKAVTALQNTGVKPNAWLLNPVDVEAIDLLRYSTDPEAVSPQKYLLDGYVNGIANSANIFGDESIARVTSTSVPAGTAILGDWSQLKLYVREDMRLDVDAGGALFTNNSAVLRAEMRAVVGHLRPASFAKVALA